jgi:hypothetical protein
MLSPVRSKKRVVIFSYPSYLGRVRINDKDSKFEKKRVALFWCRVTVSICREQDEGRGTLFMLLSKEL